MSHIAPHATSFQTSLFCQRLKTLAGGTGASTSLANLCTATERLVNSATAISRRVIEHLPQFTLHDDTHLWNVLSFMEELAGGAQGIAKLEAGDCAMAVWACFIHDLGMVLEAAELAALDAQDHCDLSTAAQVLTGPSDDQRVKDWRAYRDGHAHWEFIRKDPLSETSRMRLGIIRAAFVRDTHARIDTHTGNCRIADWIAFLQGDDRLFAQVLDDYALSTRIVPVAVSHNQDIAWLPRQLEALMLRDRAHAENLGNCLGTLHWTWIGWLLRLADVFDCDASRTPRILFERIGITDRRSRTEWRKHLAIPEQPQWQAGNDNQTLTFICQRCPGPDVEKAIYQIVGWMNEEIGKCHSALLDTPEAGRLPLSLPSRASVAIIEREGGYIYQDIEFRLDRDAVVELLMGESLYGGPELALRELVQNALDAVHLRDVRNQLATAIKKAGGKDKPRQPHQHWDPGESGRVTVTWGTDKEKGSWIKVKDNGVGMTIGTMRRFLTQIGKSYYKSDDFRAEQELMRQHGILCTAISQFGIGFLSVFMLSDRVEIHTRPLGAQDQPPRGREDLMESALFPFRAEIHGPHGLLVFYPDATLQDVGTTVTLWLKQKFVLAPIDRELVVAQLKKDFYGIGLSGYHHAELDRRSAKSNGSHLLDIPVEIGRFIVWPLYPVQVGYEKNALVLDEGFHLAELFPLDLDQLSESAEALSAKIPEIASAGWEVCDWQDRETGSRVRLVAAQPGAQAGRHASPAEWASQNDLLPSGASRLALHVCSEKQLPGNKKRYQCLVNGVRILPGLVPSADARDCQVPRIIERFPVWPGPGSWLWLDLRGSAMPALRADRAAMTHIQSERWDIYPIYERWLTAWPDTLSAWNRSLIHNKALAGRTSPQTMKLSRIGIGRASPDLARECILSEAKSISSVYADISIDARRSIYRDYSLARDINRSIDHDRNLDFQRAFALARDLARDLALDRDFARTFSGYLTRDRDIDLDLSINHPRSLANKLKHHETHDRLHIHSRNWLPIHQSRFVHTHLASEALWPSLSEAHPVLRWCRDCSKLSDYALAGPVHVSPYGSEAPDFGDYDLVVPYTAFPLGRLRRQFPNWTQDRGHRLLWLLPLLLGTEPSMQWRNKLCTSRPFDRLMLFYPAPEHDEWLFVEHSEQEWSQGSASALWDLTTGQVIYAQGYHTEDTLRTQGKSLFEWLDI